MTRAPMHRRSFLTLLGSVSAAAWPLTVRAQQDGRVRRVGVLMDVAATDQEAEAGLRAFRQGLAALGWLDGRNLHLDVRWGGPGGPLPQILARELVGAAPDVILAGTTATTQALRKATQTIPIVFSTVS